MHGYVLHQLFVDPAERAGAAWPAVVEGSPIGLVTGPNLAFCRPETQQPLPSAKYLIAESTADITGQQASPLPARKTAHCTRCHQG